MRDPEKYMARLIFLLIYFGTATFLIHAGVAVLPSDEKLGFSLVLVALFMDLAALITVVRYLNNKLKDCGDPNERKS